MAKRKRKAEQFRVVKRGGVYLCLDKNGDIVSNDKCIRLGLDADDNVTFTLNKKYCPVGVVESFNTRFKNAVAKGNKTIYSLSEAE